VHKKIIKKPQRAHGRMDSSGEKLCGFGEARL
jgi:hypothetical protein